MHRGPIWRQLLENSEINSTLLEFHLQYMDTENRQVYLQFTNTSKQFKIP